MLGQGAPVQVRIEDETYSLNAEIVTVNRQFIFEAYKNNYRTDYPDIVGGMPATGDGSAANMAFKLAKI